MNSSSRVIEDGGRGVALDAFVADEEPDPVEEGGSTDRAIAPQKDFDWVGDGLAEIIFLTFSRQTAL